MKGNERVKRSKEGRFEGGRERSKERWCLDKGACVQGLGVRVKRGGWGLLNPVPQRLRQGRSGRRQESNVGEAIIKTEMKKLPTFPFSHVLPRVQPPAQIKRYFIALTCVSLRNLEPT